jgi:hypothetical protein
MIQPDALPSTGNSITRWVGSAQQLGSPSGNTWTGDDAMHLFRPHFAFLVSSFVTASPAFCSSLGTLISILLPMPSFRSAVSTLPKAHPRYAPVSTVTGQACQSRSQSRAIGTAPIHPPTIQPTNSPQTPASSNGNHAAKMSRQAKPETPCV